MASLLSPRRTAEPVSLQATEPDLELTVPISSAPQLPTVGWVLAAVGAGLVTAGAGWVLTSGLTVLGWLSAEPGTLGQALGLGTQLWLLSNGGGARIAGSTVSLVPWGITLLIAFTAARGSAFVTRLVHDRSGRTAWTVPALITVSYLGVLAIACLLAATSEQALRASTLMAPLLAAATAWGCCRARGWSPTGWLPLRVRSLPRAVLAAQLALVAGGASVLVTALVLRIGRIETLQAALQTGLTGGIVLLCAQLAVAPNAIVWAASYALGAGFAVGPGSAVAPAATELGLLPAVPILGALPAAGPGSLNLLWWLGVGVLAGAVAAVVVAQGRAAARFDESGLIGGLAGVLAGLAFTGIAWLSGGDLGTGRMTGLGPRLVPLMVMAVSTLGLSGVLTGLLVGVSRQLLGRRGAPSTRPD